MSLFEHWGTRLVRKEAQAEINKILPMIQQQIKSKSGMCKVESIDEDGTLTVKKADGTLVKNVNPGSKPVGPGSTRILSADSRLT